jgi:uncharacterized lipoprotein NlpE involved in copper resistance
LFKIKPVLLIAAIAITAAMPLIGCEDNSKPDMKDAKERVKKMQSFVEIYKAVNGNYDALSPSQKADLLAIQGGSEMRAKSAFIGAKEGPMAAQKYLAEARARGEK